MSHKHGITVYYSSVSGNTLWTKHTDRVEFLLSANKIPFQSVDVSTEPEALQYMKRGSQLKNIGQLPQVFRDGQFIGGKEELDEANEYGELKQLLGLEAVPAPAPDASAAPSQPSAATSSVSSPPPTAAHTMAAANGTATPSAPPAINRANKPSASTAAPPAKPSCPSCGRTQAAEWQKKCMDCNKPYA